MSDTRPPILDWPFSWSPQTRISHHVQNRTIQNFHLLTHSCILGPVTDTGRMSPRQPVENSCSCMSEMLTVKQRHGKVEFIGYSELLANRVTYWLTEAADVTAGDSFGLFTKGEKRVGTCTGEISQSTFHLLPLSHLTFMQTRVTCSSFPETGSDIFSL